LCTLYCKTPHTRFRIISYPITQILNIILKLKSNLSFSAQNRTSIYNLPSLNKAKKRTSGTINKSSSTKKEKAMDFEDNIERKILSGFTYRSVNATVTRCKNCRLELIRWGADTSLARHNSRFRRTELIVSVERGICSCAELQVFSCYRG
jgi:hypothetical protein